MWRTNTSSAGAISQDTLLELFRRGEILPDGRTNGDEVALIKAGEVLAKDAMGAKESKAAVVVAGSEGVSR